MLPPSKDFSTFQGGRSSGNEDEKSTLSDGRELDENAGDPILEGGGKYCKEEKKFKPDKKLDEQEDFDHINGDEILSGPLPSQGQNSIPDFDNQGKISQSLFENLFKIFNELIILLLDF